ncbi:MAG: 3'(2'),5'-bisphosphate nucleotidase CysQ family protein [Candidatus Woesearchaeota archaeon]
MLEKIIRIAKEAGNIIINERKKGLVVKTKSSPFDFVTSADEKSETHIIRELKREFPSYQVLAEEQNKEIEQTHSNIWMVDPLDGTKDFKNGGSGFSVMIGLYQNGRPVLGVVYAPDKNIIYYAQKGTGSYMLKDGAEKRIYVSKTSSIEESKVVTRIPHGEIREEDRLVDYFNASQKIPESSVGIKLGLIARGLADFHVSSNSKTSKWDTCAPQIILEEAGGKLTDSKGKPLNYNQKQNLRNRSFVASNGLLHQNIIEKIKQYEGM